MLENCLFIAARGVAKTKKKGVDGIQTSFHNLRSRALLKPEERTQTFGFMALSIISHAIRFANFCTSRDLQMSRFGLAA